MKSSKEVISANLPVPRWVTDSNEATSPFQKGLLSIYFVNEVLRWRSIRVKLGTCISISLSLANEYFLVFFKKIWDSVRKSEPMGDIAKVPFRLICKNNFGESNLLSPST